MPARPGRLALMVGGLLLVAPVGAAPAAAASFAEKPATPALIQQLRGGGFVLYLRHGETDNTRADRVPAVDLNDCRSQRPLTARGRETAGRVGAAIRKAKIPIGEIAVSPLCRTRDTVALAFPGQPARVDPYLMYTANLTDSQKAPIIANTRRLLSSGVAAGYNRLLVAHAPNLMDLIGYFPKEATLVVFRPKGAAGFEYVASVAPSRWSELTR